MDYYLLATGCCVVAMSYTMFVANRLYQRADHLAQRIQRLERLLSYSPEPSEEGSGG